jgi:L-asparaginase
MDGRLERFAGVINLEKIKNPILAASALLREDSRVLSGEGAQKYARALGLKLTDTRTADSVRRWKKNRNCADVGTIDKGVDTVGAVALDRCGNLASATSTGGRGLERPGRVSDSGMPVANFADSRVAISATGIGEQIIEEGLAIKIATRVRDGMNLKQAFQKTFREVRAKVRRMGAVAVDVRGNIQAFTTTEVMLFAYHKNKSQIFY